MGLATAIVVLFLGAVPASAHKAMPATGVAGLTCVLPAVMNAAYGGYTTAIYIEDVSHTGSAANITINYYDQSGTVINPTTATIPFWGEMTFRQDSGTALPVGHAGWAMVTSDNEIAVFVNEFAPGTGADGSSYTSIQLPAGAGQTLFAPAIARNAYGGYTTGIGLANTGASSAAVTVNYHDPAGTLTKQQMVTVPGHGFAGLYSGDLALGLPDGFTGTATIINTTPAGTALAAIVNETGPGGQFSSYDAVATGASTLYDPAAMHNAYGGFNTGIGIQNTASGMGAVTVTYYDASGIAAGAVTKNLSPFGYVGLYQGGADGPPASSSAYSAVITATVPIAAVVNEVSPGGKQSTSFNSETAGSGWLDFATVENAGSDGFSTGLAIMNITAASISFTLTYFDATTGSGLSTLPLTLPAHGYMGRYTPSDLPSGTRATAWFFSSTPGLAGIANEAGTGTLMSYNGQ